MKRLQLVHFLFLACFVILIFALTGCMITYRVHQWNLLVYMNADNNLEEYGIDNINEMEFAGPSPYVNIFVLFDRIPGWDSSNGDWTGTRLYKINWDTNQDLINSQLLVDYGELDMSNPDTLRDFIITCNQYSPADHTLLTLWNHGDGVYPRSVTRTVSSLTSNDGALFDASTRGISWDNTTGIGDDYCLTTDEVATALADAGAITGKKIDIINMDACLMLMLEVAYEWRNEADYLVGSEALTPAPGNNYYGILQSLKNGPISPRDEAIAIVDAFYAWYSSTIWDRTYSAITLGDEFAQLFSAFNTFATALNATPDPDKADVRDSWAASVFFANPRSSYDYIDLYSFAEQIFNNVNITDPPIKAAAAPLMAAINSVVIRHYNMGSYISNPAHGISVLLPGNAAAWANYSAPNRYPDFDLSYASDWDEFIGQFIDF